MADILVGRGVRRPAPTLFDLISGPSTAAQSALGAMGSAAKGAAQATVGLPGDIESLVRMLTGGEQRLPTTEQVGQFVNQYIRAPYPQYERLGEFTGLPTAGVLTRPATQITNEAADALVRAITRNPQATAPGVIQETAMPFMQAVAPRTPGLLETPVKSDIGFYSKLEEATLPLQNKGTGAQYLAQIEKTAGVKPEELQWTGLDEFLKSRQNVTKAEIQDYLAQNRVNVQEVRLGGPESFNQQKLAQLENEFAALRQHPIDDPSFGEEKYNEMIRLMNIRDQSTTSDLYRQADDAMKYGQQAQTRGDQKTAEGFFRQYELLNTRAEKLDLENLGMQNPPKFSQYTLPGGENYREILLTLPERTRVKSLAEVNEGRSWRGAAPLTQERYDELVARGGLQDYAEGTFKSSHFDQPNILAHMRVNDRVVDGKKTLFIEEIQSDWHQAGRKKGYATPETKRLTGVVEAEPPSEFGFSPEFKVVWEDGTFSGGYGSREAAQARAAEGKSNAKAGVPDAPFKTTWHELALKRAIQEASEKGYDQIAFTTGKTQAERYDLSKQVDTIAYRPVGDGKFEISAIKDGNSVMTEYGKTVEDLENLVGKDIAQKIANNEGALAEGFRGEKGKVRELSGVDLKVGGEGMKGFYDQILPKSLEKLGKKFDAKLTKTDMDGVEIWAMDITPKMRESALTKGQPLFAATPAIPAAGLLGDEGE